MNGRFVELSILCALSLICVGCPDDGTGGDDAGDTDPAPDVAADATGDGGADGEGDTDGDGGTAADAGEDADDGTAADTGADADGATDGDAVGPTGWQSRAEPPAGPRQEQDVVALDGKLYVMGGYDGGRSMVDLVEVYDPAEDEWSSAASLPKPMHHINSAVAGGKIYVLGYLVGGFAAEGNSYVYDPATDDWQQRQAMPDSRRRGASAVGAIGGKIFVAGGLRGGAARSEVSVYDPSSDSWSQLPDMPRPVDHAGSGVVDGKLVVAGGRRGGIRSHTDRVDVYDPEAETWSQKTSMPTSRAGVAAAVWNGRLIVIGGEGNEADDDGVFADVEMFDLGADTWQILPELETPRHGMDAAAIGEFVYVPGGADVEAFGAVATHSRLRLTGQ